MTSFGIEYQLSEQMMIGLSYTVYNMKNKLVLSEEFIFPSYDGILYVEDVDVDLDYDKIGFSIIYGFEIESKKDRNEKN